MGKRLGILGGTFDPVHYGHLIIAEEAVSCLSLDLVLFVPTGIQPLKQASPITPAPHRLAMLELALAGNTRFAVSRAEVDRPGVSYTVETLDRLRSEAGPAADFWFIVGEDALANLLAWRDPAGILARTRLAVAPRHSAHVNWTRLEAALPGLRERIDPVPAPLVAISATDLRARVAARRPIRYQVPEAVAAYILAHELFK